MPWSFMLHFDSWDKESAHSHPNCLSLSLSLSYSQPSKPTQESKRARAYPRVAVNLLIEARVLVALANVEGFAGRRALAGDAASDRNAPPGGVLIKSVCARAIERADGTHADADAE